MIYLASRRTDMTAFFPDQLADRVQRSRKLEAIVLWTKDVRNLVRHPRLREVIARVPAVVQYTVTGLAGSVWEPRVPPLAARMDELRELAGMLPPGAVRWRFDPVVPRFDLEKRFAGVKAELESALGELDGVIVSFPDPYRHAVARAAAAGLEWPVVPPAARRETIAMMVDAFGGPRPGGPVRLCCEPGLLELPGVAMARCVDGALFERLYGLPLGGLEKDSGQRAACGCVRSTDIGSYDMVCPHRCLYCYAARDAPPATAR